MRAKASLGSSIDYADFQSPYSGLAVMIFVQADNDLKSLQGRDSFYREGCVVDKYEILNFLRSRWAAILADGLGWDELDLMQYEERTIWKK